MSLIYSHSAGRAYAEKDGVVFFDTDSYPVQFFPTAGAITLTGYTITFPDLMKGNAYAFARGMEGASLKCACSSFVTVGAQEWGPSYMDPAPTSGHSLSTSIVGTVPGDTDILLCRAKMTRTTAPSQMNGNDIPVMFKEGEWVTFSGNDLIVERFGTIFARLFTLRISNSTNFDGTRNVIAERRQSVKSNLYSYWNDGNDETESGWTYGGDAGAYGHIVNAIESKGPSTDGSGLGTLYRRDAGSRCSLTDNTDYESVFTGDIEIIPGRTGISALDITGRRSFTLVHEEEKQPGTTTHSYTGVPIGPEHATRRVWVTIRGFKDESSGTVRSVSSVSIAGVSATLAGDRNVVDINDDKYILAIYYADVPTGDSGTISVTFSASIDRSAIQVFAGYNMNNTVEFTASGGSTVSAGSFDTPASLSTVADGYAVAIAVTNAGATVDFINFSGIDNSQGGPFFSTTEIKKFRGYSSTDGTSLSILFDTPTALTGFGFIYAMSIS